MSMYYETATHSIAAGVVLSIVDTFVVSLKFWTRRIQKQPLKADDWLLVPATILTVGIGVVLTYGATHKAIGWPLVVPPDYQGNINMMYTDQVSLSRKVQYAFILMHPLALGLTKASLLFLYKRIFATERKTRALLTTSITVVALWTVAFFFSEVFQCKTNFWANWGTTHDIQTQCLKTTKILWAVCLTDFALDLLVLIIPIPLTLRLKLSAKKMAAVLGIFLLGAITVAASLLRLIVLTGLVFSPHSATASHRFVSITTSMYWGMVESSIGIIVACLPTIQFLFRRNSLTGASRSVTMRRYGKVDISRPRPFQSSFSSGPTNQTEDSVDVAYSNKYKSPIVDRAVVLV
ncbi:hypothetical protein F5B22DRAFT_649477 [Xylaria bambusicola]|uniref:uncharacterized protein n=1 Tax=Xylaria bambusicola TaxID=326684 RepID=UPI0020074664|nr:uncharacterized protein F5B22DRAFT_649477 [Xylaria bambusicola]KAI0508977.1 hypothetical protein F5B22DRAFT_649477 [Xylaria bambusicola]